LISFLPEAERSMFISIQCPVRQGRHAKRISALSSRLLACESEYDAFPVSLLSAASQSSKFKPCLMFLLSSLDAETYTLCRRFGISFVLDLLTTLPVLVCRSCNLPVASAVAFFLGLGLEGSYRRQLNSRT